MIYSTNALISNEFWRGNNEEQLYFGYGTSKPNEYLLNPEVCRLILSKNEESSHTYLKINTHHFYTNHLGEPTEYKTSERINIHSV